MNITFVTEPMQGGYGLALSASSTLEQFGSSVVQVIESARDGSTIHVSLRPMSAERRRLTEASYCIVMKGVSGSKAPWRAAQPEQVMFTVS